MIEYGSTIEEDEILSFGTTDEYMEGYVKWNKLYTWRQILHDFIHLWNIKTLA